jgi:hypothetical protein
VGRSWRRATAGRSELGLNMQPHRIEVTQHLADPPEASLCAGAAFVYVTPRITSVESATLSERRQCSASWLPSREATAPTSYRSVIRWNPLRRRR